MPLRLRRAASRTPTNKQKLHSMSKNPQGKTQPDRHPNSEGGGGSPVIHPHIKNGHWNPGIPTEPARSATNKDEFFGPGEIHARLRPGN